MCNIKSKVFILYLTFKPPPQIQFLNIELCDSITHPELNLGAAAAAADTGALLVAAFLLMVGVTVSGLFFLPPRLGEGPALLGLQSW